MAKLCKHFDKIDPSWRDSTIVMMDNAAYHRTAERLGHFERLRIPIMFLGPYHYKMSPVELYFNYIKGFNLHTC